MKNWITILDWDSNFFGRKICRVDRNIADEGELLSVTERLSAEDVELAYYFSSLPLNENFVGIKKYSINLVDRKTTYKKTIDENIRSNVSVFRYSKDFPEPKLLKLAVESGVYSRFKVDDKIGINKFEDLYTTWIINSVNKKIAKEVLVYKANDIIAGFVTLGEKNLKADIGIIAVDAVYRGKGIGKSLMHSAESWFGENTDFKEIQVVTQGANVAACRLYESCGYLVDKIEYVYHLWKKDNA